MININSKQVDLNADSPPVPCCVTFPTKWLFYRNTHIGLFLRIDQVRKLPAVVPEMHKGLNVFPF